MTTAVATEDRELNPWWFIGATVLVSLVGHALVLGWAATRPPHVAPPKPVVVDIVAVPPKPPPPPPPPKEEPPKPPPKVRPPVKVETPKPPTIEPPPPNEPPPTPVKAPVIVGLSLSSTTTSGGFAVPVGNTLMGKSDTKAVNPGDVKPYSAPKYVPAGGADRDPELAQEVKIPYPEEARKAGIEGSVRMKLTVDPDGHVTEVTVLSGPGYGLNEAARDAVRRFRFRPALKAGEPVGTSMVYTYTFLLD